MAWSYIHNAGIVHLKDYRQISEVLVLLNLQGHYSSFLLSSINSPGHARDDLCDVVWKDVNALPTKQAKILSPLEVVSHCSKT